MLPFESVLNDCLSMVPGDTVLLEIPRDITIKLPIAMVTTGPITVFLILVCRIQTGEVIFYLQPVNPLCSLRFSSIIIKQ